MVNKKQKLKTNAETILTGFAHQATLGAKGYHTETQNAIMCNVMLRP
jgi:hypothetical protein